MIALAFLLVAAFVAGAIVTAAYVNSGKSVDRNDEQQAYLAASSAATLIMDNMEKGSSTDAPIAYSYSYKTYEYSCSSHTKDDTVVGTTTSGAGGSSDEDSFILGDFINEDCESLAAWNFGNTSAYTLKGASYELIPDDTIAAETTINVAAYMDENYKITCDIKAASGSEDFDIQLIFTPSVKTTSSSSTEYGVHTHSHTEVDSETSEEYTVYEYFDLTTTTHTVTVTWPTCSVIKK